MLALPNLERVSRLWADMAMAVGFIFIIALALIGTVDVVMTALFARALKGAIEISSNCYAATIFLGLPYAQRLSQHIVVDLITNRMPPRLRTACSIFSLLCTLAFLLFLSTRMWGFATGSLVMLERDSGVLMLPVYPFKLLALFGLSAATLEAGRQLLELMLPKRGV